MTSTVPRRLLPPPRAAALLPVAYVAHLAEEWFGGFVEWTQVAPLYEISVERFILINSVALAVFVIGTFAAFRQPRLAWFGVSLAALLGLNGVLHALLTVGLGYYSPGVVTGLLIYVPLSFVVLRSSKAALSNSVFVRSAWFGVAMHALVIILASV